MNALSAIGVALLNGIAGYHNSIENPRISLNDPRAWDELFGTGLSDTGIRVTPKTALGYPPLWRAINLIADKLAILPLRIFRHTSPDDDTQVEKFRDHPAYYLVHWRANDILTAGQFKRLMTYHALFRGNGYAAIFRDGVGRPVELLPLSPTNTNPVQENGRLVYVSRAGGEKRVIPARDVLHIKGLSYDGLVGHDIITVMADALGLGIAARKFGSKFFANGAHQGGVLQIPRGMSDKAANQLRADWKKGQEGLDNAFRTALLEDGAKWVPTMVNPDNAQMQPLRQFEVREVANVFGLPPHNLGDDSRLAYNSLEQENKAVLEDCYDPWLHRWEEECDDKLLTDAERGYEIFREQRRFRGLGCYFEFDRSPLQRPDEMTQANIDDKRVNSGICTLNEIRAQRNWPPAPPEIGNEYRIPTQVTMGLPPEPADPSLNLDKGTDAADNAQNAVIPALRELLEDRIGRFADIETDHICKAATRGGNFLDWLEKWLNDHEAKVKAAVKPIFKAIDAANVAETPRNDAETWAKQYAERLKNTVLSACEVPANRLAESVADKMQSAAFRASLIHEVIPC